MHLRLQLFLPSTSFILLIFRASRSSSSRPNQSCKQPCLTLHEYLQSFVASSTVHFVAPRRPLHPSQPCLCERRRWISISCILAFCVNLSTFLVIGATNPVTYQVCALNTGEDNTCIAPRQHVSATSTLGQLSALLLCTRLHRNSTHCPRPACAHIPRRHSNIAPQSNILCYLEL